MTLFVQQLVNGLTLAAMYLLVALGITLVYGLTRVAFFAQGEMVTLGAFLTYEFHRAGLPFGVGLVIAAACVGVASQSLYVTLFQRTVTRHFNGFVISLGLIIGLEGVYALIWPIDNYTIPRPIQGNWIVNGVVFDHNRVALVLICVAVTAALVMALNHTQAGRGIRAIALQREASRVLGVPVRLLTAVTFMVGCGIAALAGGILGTVFGFNAYFGGQFLFTGFAIAVVGGLGNVTGAMIAAVVLSLTQTLGSAYVSLRWGDVFNLGAIIAMMLIWPHGLRRGTQAVLLLGGSEAAIAYGVDPLEAVHRAASRARNRARALILERSVPFGIVATVVVLAVLAPWLLPTARLLSDATYAVVLATAGYGVWFLFRSVGIPQIGQFGFVGIGAYAAALSWSHWHLNFWLQLLLAMALAGLVSTLMGVVALRTGGAYFLIVLFAFTQLIVVVLEKWQSLTGGPLGLIQLDAPRPLGSLVDFSAPRAMYWLALTTLGVTALAVLGVSATPFGRRLITIRDDELLAQSLGLSTFPHKLLAMVVTGAIGGIAGVMFLYAQAGIEPTQFGVFPGAYLLLIMLLGGVGVWIGPVVGAAVFVFLPEVLHLGPNEVQVAYGVLLIAIIAFLPSGITGTIRQIYYKAIRASRSPTSAVAEVN